MKRRDALCAIGSGVCFLSGCSHFSNDYPRITISSTYPSPPDGDMTVSVVRQYSDTHPAKIEISYTYTRDSTTEVVFQASPPFSSYKAQTPDEEMVSLLIIPDDHSHFYPSVTLFNTSSKEVTDYEVPSRSELIPETPADGCWRRTVGAVIYGTGIVKDLSPGDEFTEQYTVLWNEDTTCLKPGEYTFEQQNYLGTDAPWGFTIRIH